MLVLIVIIVIIVVVDSNRREKIEDREDRREIKVESQKVEKPSKFSLCGRKRRRRATIFGALIGAKVAKGYGTTDIHMRQAPFWIPWWMGAASVYYHLLLSVTICPVWWSCRLVIIL